MCLVILAFLFTKRPVVLIVVISAVEAPVLSISAIALLYLIHKRVPKTYHPGIIWHLVIIVGTIAYLLLSGLVFVQILIDIF